MEIATSSAAIEMQQEPRQSCALATIGWPNNTPHPNAEAMKVLALLDQVRGGRKVGRTGGQVGRWVGGRVFLFLWIIPPRLTTTCPVCYFLYLDHFILRFPEPFTMRFPLLLSTQISSCELRSARTQLAAAATTIPPCFTSPHQSATYAMGPHVFTAKESSSCAGEQDQSVNRLHTLLMGPAGTTAGHHSQQQGATHSSATLFQASLPVTRRTTMTSGACALDQQHELAMGPMLRLLMEAPMSRCVGD